MPNGDNFGLLLLVVMSKDENDLVTSFNPHVPAINLSPNYPTLFPCPYKPAVINLIQTAIEERKCNNTMEWKKIKWIHI